MRLRHIGAGTPGALALALMVVGLGASAPAVSRAAEQQVQFGIPLEDPQTCDGYWWCYEFAGKKYDQSCSYLNMALGNPIWGGVTTLYGKQFFRSTDEYRMHNPYNETFADLSPMAVNGIDEWQADGEQTLFLAQLGRCAENQMAMREWWQPDLSVNVVSSGPLLNATFASPSCENFPQDMANFRKLTVTVREAFTAAESDQQAWVASRCFANLTGVDINYSQVGIPTNTSVSESSDGLTATMVNVPNTYALQAENESYKALVDADGNFITNVFAARSYSQAGNPVAAGCPAPCLGYEMRDPYQSEVDYQGGIAYGDRIYDEADVSWTDAVVLRVDMDTTGIAGASSVRYGYLQEDVWGNPSVWSETKKQELVDNFGWGAIPNFVAKLPVERYSRAPLYMDPIPVNEPWIETSEDFRYTSRWTVYAEILDVNGDVIATRSVQLPFLRPVVARNACFEANGGGCSTDYGSYGQPGY